MRQEEEKQIKRLIDTGNEDNLSLAYNLMVGIGIDSVDAIMQILNYNERLSDMMMSELVTKFASWEVVVVDGIDCCDLVIVDNYDLRGSGHDDILVSDTMPSRDFYGWEDAAKAMLTRTRKIWESRI